MLNKTRVDNLPPLQELSVFEQSFESRRKQQTSQALRSRSKNYRNFDTGSYTGGTKTSNDLPSSKIMVEEGSMPFEYNKNTGFHKGIKNDNIQKRNFKNFDTNDVVIDNSISVISSIANPGKDVLLKTGATVLKTENRKLPTHSTTEHRELRYYGKKINSSLTSHSRFTIK